MTMKTATSPAATDRRLNLLWLALAAATGLTWKAGDGAGAMGLALVVFIFALAVLKGSVVILDFMELRHAPALWRRLVLGWLLLVTAAILLLHSIGSP